ncbi:hypothetical protein [Clostridium estertheticum]|uniref:hypothetical protein n=1 Tax=Clostridium estertheticum TaxID=238834 RepID=UPI001C0AFAE7|nr:hypothetical protein [Clostridium estertheticum]MBU3186581.1 hypothetical protein [Clostridium estertheticum]
MKNKGLDSKKLKIWTESKTSEVVDQKNILLTEEIHTHSKYINVKKLLPIYQDEDIIDKVIVVRILKGRGYMNKYSLITGLKGLMIARALDKPIKCIVLKASYNRYKFVKMIDKVGVVKEEIKVPEGTDFLYPVGKVKVAAFLKKHSPNGFKYKKKEDYYLENQVVDKPITVIRNNQDKNGVLVVDEYTRFLVLVKYGVKNIPIKFAV